jgi:hypothetical protein
VLLEDLGRCYFDFFKWNWKGNYGHMFVSSGPIILLGSIWCFDGSSLVCSCRP